MPINPNKAFKDTSKNPESIYKPGTMMTEGQRALIERKCKEHDVSLIRLTTTALGFRKKTKQLTHEDAARCITILNLPRVVPFEEFYANKSK